MLALTTTPGGAQVIESVPSGMNPDIVEPVVVNAYSAMTSPAFWRAMNFLADNLASFGRSVRRDGARVRDETRHPLERLLTRRPNAYRNAYVFWRTWFYHAASAGNGYARIIRDDAGTPVALQNVLPRDVYTILFTRPGSKTPEQWYMLQPGNVIIPAADMLHLQGLSYDGTIGMDPVQLHGEAIARGVTIDRFVTKYLQKGTNIRGSIEFPRDVPDAKLKAIRAELLTHFYGANAKRDVLMLTDGATFKNSTQSPAESQLVQQAAYTTKQIAQITGVPPEFLYEQSESKYNTSVEQAGTNVVRYTFRPWITQAQDELTTKLLTTAEQDEGLSVRINPDALLRGDAKTQTDTVIAKRNAGIITGNEAREYFELAPISDPEADKLKTLGSTQKADAPAASLQSPPAESGSPR